MPTYVYRRLGPDGKPDGTTFEVFQRISDNPLTVDPETGEPVERVIGGGAGLIFKGTGFYQTDYVQKSGTPETGPDKGSESKADATSEAKSDAKSGSKPDAKTEAKSASSSNGKAEKAD